MDNTTAITTARRLRVECAKEAKALRTTDPDTAAVLSDIAHDLVNVEARAANQDWRDFSNTVEDARRSLTGDFSWRIP